MFGSTLFFCFVFGSSTVFAEVKLAKLFSDHVVLQRQKPIPVWGWANPNENVSVTFGGQNKSATADSTGKWTVIFAPMEATGESLELKATAKSGNVTVKDVLIGEVWLCSGQSNMEFTVKQADNFAGEKKDADYPQIRQFYVEHVVEPSPQKDLKSGEWKASSPETVGDFTAVGFFFARDVYKKLKVPIGLVHSSWGGSQVESWISKDAMLSVRMNLKVTPKSLPTDWAGFDALCLSEMSKKQRSEMRTRIRRLTMRKNILRLISTFQNG